MMRPGYGGVVLGRSTSGALPDLIEPMLPGTGELPAGEDWAVEFAWEGLRVLAYARPNRVRLLTVTGRNVTASFPDLEAPLADAVPNGGAVLDGTVVALGEGGFPRRRLLQSRTSTPRPSEALLRRVPVGFLISDLLWLDGRSTVELPYHRRRDKLEGLELDNVRLWASPSFPATQVGPVMVAAEQHGADALHAKHLYAPYRPSRRSRNWLRLPVRPVRQVLVGGWSPADPHRPDSIGALLLGVPQDDRLRYVGRVGLRSAADRNELADVLPALRRARSPFRAPPPPEIAEHARWTDPRLVGRVEFADWTADGRLRLPVWRGVVPLDQIDPQQFPRLPEVAAPPTPAPAPPPPQPQPRTEARRLEQHFVYNSLNTIASLVRTDPTRARELLLGFADLTRATDQATSAAEATSTLGAELATVHHYLQLEQARFGKRLRSSVDVDPALHPLPVRPLAVLAAVRSVVQQQIEPRPEGGSVTVSAEVVDGDCVLRVVDEDVAEPVIVALGAAR
jgi:bifunctional non-homologous end joining protein LigD